MAYNTKKLEEKAVKIINDKKCFFIQDVIPYLPCSCSTFYDKELEKSEAIKDALELNRTAVKISLRSKWYKSQNATLQIALMRLVCSDTERRKLAMNYNEHTGKDGESLFGNVSDEKAKKIAESLKSSSK